MRIDISNEVKTLCPAAALGILHYKVNVRPSPEELLALLEGTIERLSGEYTMKTIAENPHIAATRRGYKALGKDPHDYRNAAEAMLRRVVKGQGLYHINNVVEVNNLVSLSSGYSIGSYDVGELRGSITLRRAEEGARYEGIGKGKVNIGHLPVLYDDLGAFGNPTSDSRRAMIRPGRREVVSVLYSFDGCDELNRWTEEFSRLLEQYCGVREIETWNV